MNNILVFPAGTEIGLEIHRAFKGIKDVNLIGGTSSDDHSEFVYKQMIGLPHISDEKFIPSLGLVIKKEFINFIYPAHDDVILRLARERNKIKCEVIGSPVETCEVCRSKSKTYRHFKNILRTPKVYEYTHSFNLHSINYNYPVFLKPDVGQGSKGTHLALRHADTIYHKEQDPTLLIMESLPGEEYTVDCFTDFNGMILYHSARKRDRISNGIAVRTQNVCEHDIPLMAQTINANLRFNGAWHFQAKRARDGELCLLEIAPRIAGSSGLQRVRGVNLPVLSYYNYFNIPVKIEPCFDSVIMDRALTNRYKLNIEYDHVYVDIDDTLIIDGKVNCQLVHFLYQCLNNGKKIHGLTRGLCIHPICLRLNLFDTFKKSVMTAKKSFFITEKKSIFIDDSFSERSEVHAALGIPVFSVDAVECLLED